jgi:regulator of RNase E activity RraA
VHHDSLPAALAQFDTCVLSDAIDSLGMQLRNRGFARPGLRLLTRTPVVVAGYAATARIRASDPPILGQTYFRQTEWWREISLLPRPRIVAIEDIDRVPGRGACIGELAASAFRAVGCAAAVTNGSARDLEWLEESGFPVLAAQVSPSRAYAHLVEHTCEVQILGLTVRHGDLLVADRHGLLSIPPAIAERVCQTAAEIRNKKRAFVEFCTSSEFSIEVMEEKLRQMQP